MIFESRQVQNPATIGEELAYRRGQAGWTTGDLAEKAGVSVSIITVLEANDYSRIGSDIYTKQGLKRLAEIFGVPAKDWQERLTREREGLAMKTTSVALPAPKQLAIPIVTYWLSRGALWLTVTGLVLYLGLGVGKMVAPPMLEVQLSDGLVIHEHEIEIRGLADVAAHVTINGGEVSKGQDGYFYDRVGLGQGINVIEVSAESKYGKKTIVTRRVVVQ